jgi:hypothetical protein
MLVRDVRTGRLIMVPDQPANTQFAGYASPYLARRRGYGGYSSGLGYYGAPSQLAYDQQLGLPFLAALAPLAAKALAFLPSLIGGGGAAAGAAGSAASAAPSILSTVTGLLPQLSSLLPQGSPVTATAVPSPSLPPTQPLPLPPAQTVSTSESTTTIAPASPLPAASGPVSSQASTSQSETVIEPMRVRQPNGMMAVVPVRVRRRKRRRVRVMRRASPAIRWVPAPNGGATFSGGPIFY